MGSEKGSGKIRKLRIDDEIQIIHLTKKFGELTVFDNLNLAFQKGQTTCLMGKSGCGKTTLIHLMVGLLKPEKGRITGIEGSKISMVFQENRLCRHLSGLCNCLLPLKSTEENRIRVRNLLLDVGLDSTAIAKPVIELSGGMQRRVAIIRALAADSDIIFMDEPLKELDEHTEKLVVECIKRETSGKTLILATHSVEDVERFSAKAVYLERSV